MRDVHDDTEPLDRGTLDALAGAAGRVEDAGVRWEALAARITAAAELPLARRRGGWQRTAARWSGRMLPLAAAAGLLLAVGIALAPARETGLVLEEVMAVAASDGLGADYVGLEAQDAFLSTMLNGGE